MTNRKRHLLQEFSYTVMYEPVGRKGYQVMVPALRGLVSYGRNLNEAREMAKDAIRCYLESLKEHDENFPVETSLLQERVTVKI